MSTRALFAITARQLRRPGCSFRIATPAITVASGSLCSRQPLLIPAPSSNLFSQQQCRDYGSSKKGAKRGKGGSKRGKEDDEDSGPVEMTLDLDKMTEQMEHSVGRFAEELQAVRAGRASPAILNGVRVVLKGGSASLPDLAMIAVKDAQNLI
ncbi:hypothetical protein LPJ71_002758, partial [Coemansia sp. S17]